MGTYVRKGYTPKGKTVTNAPVSSSTWKLVAAGTYLRSKKGSRSWRDVPFSVILYNTGKGQAYCMTVCQQFAYCYGLTWQASNSYCHLYVTQKVPLKGVKGHSYLTGSVGGLSPTKVYPGYAYSYYRLYGLVSYVKKQFTAPKKFTHAPISSSVFKLLGSNAVGSAKKGQNYYPPRLSKSNVRFSECAETCQKLALCIGFTYSDQYLYCQVYLSRAPM